MLRISSAVWLESSAESGERPIPRRIAFERAWMAEMKGPNAAVKARSNRALRNAPASGRRSAHIFGACSPSVMCSIVINNERDG